MILPIKYQTYSCYFLRLFWLVQEPLIYNANYNKKIGWIEWSKVTNALSFYWSQNLLCQSKFFEPFQELDCFGASSKTFVPAQKPILLHTNHLFVWHKMVGLAHYVNRILGWLKKIGPAQKHFGTYKGQGTSK